MLKIGNLRFSSMKTREGKELPFSVNRNDARSLLDQVADGLRAAIVGGYYKPGDAIPSSRELCPLLGVSRIVTKAALERLAAEGYVLSRTGSGTVVSTPGVKQWRGHVVFVCPEGDHNFIQAIIGGTLRDRLVAAGYLFSAVNTKRGADGKYNFAYLDAFLARSVDLVVVMYNSDEICRHLAKRNVPFTVFREVCEIQKGAVGFTHLNHSMAAGDFAARCAAIGAKRVVEVYWNRYMCDVTPACHALGIAVKKVKLTLVDRSYGSLLRTKQSGFEALSNLLDDWRRRNPGRRFDAWNDSRTVYFIADDYITTGALLAIMEAGLRIPEDIRLATLSNAGLGPFFCKELSRMEFDPVAAGEKLADYTLEYLKTGKYPSGRAVGPKWIDGETMG